MLGKLLILFVQEKKTKVNKYSFYPNKPINKSINFSLNVYQQSGIFKDNLL